MNYIILFVKIFKNKFKIVLLNIVGSQVVLNIYCCPCIFFIYNLDVLNPIRIGRIGKYRNIDAACN